MRSKICYDDILKIKCFVLNAIDLFSGVGGGGGAKLTSLFKNKLTGLVKSF